MGHSPVPDTPLSNKTKASWTSINCKLMVLWEREPRDSRLFGGIRNDYPGFMFYPKRAWSWSEGFTNVSVPLGA
jgi:hypothetical protein